MMGVMRIEERLTARGLVLPAPMKPPPGMALPFPWVRLWPNHLPGRACPSNVVTSIFREWRNGVALAAEGEVTPRGARLAARVS